MVDDARPVPIYAAIHAFIADTDNSCLYLKYDTALLDSRLQTTLYPILDALYADPTTKARSGD